MAMDWQSACKSPSQEVHQRRHNRFRPVSRSGEQRGRDLSVTAEPAYRRRQISNKVRRSAIGSANDLSQRTIANATHTTKRTKSNSREDRIPALVQSNLNRILTTRRTKAWCYHSRRRCIGHNRTAGRKSSISRQPMATNSSDIIPRDEIRTQKRRYPGCSCAGAQPADERSVQPPKFLLTHSDRDEDNPSKAQQREISVAVGPYSARSW